MGRQRALQPALLRWGIDVQVTEAVQRNGLAPGQLERCPGVMDG